ncbi:MAG: hypothetical protein KGL90_00765 [Burkholderiales bacterium]|nr:hypothetical protein [Burkholderiales bacterium]
MSTPVAPASEVLAKLRGRLENARGRFEKRKLGRLTLGDWVVDERRMPALALLELPDEQKSGYGKHY